MIKEYTFKGLAYISGAYQDRQRCDVVKFQFDASQKVEVAKLNLLGTDLKTYDGVLLEVSVKISKNIRGTQGVRNGAQKKKKKSVIIR